MIEVDSRDGRARVALWRHGDAEARTPDLVLPATSLLEVPPWIRVVSARSPSGQPGRIELLSGGTWFHPIAQEGGLVVEPPAPAPTDKVQVVAVGEDLAVFHDAGGWASNPKSFMPALAEARTQATPARLLWVPALGTPADYAIWAYLGADLFDASPLLLAAVRGVALTPDGPLPAEAAARIHGDGSPWDAPRLAAFNVEQARQELERVRQAIADGTLRRLAERRAYVAAPTVETLRRFDREHAYLEAAAPRHRATPLPAMTSDSLWMPEVEAFRRTFRDAYEPPASARVLVILPCSQRKPYATSRSHRLFARVLDDSGLRPLLHEVMVTSPLGLVPRDLEETYPANQYDIPVTGHWTRDEEAIVQAQLAPLLAKGRYDHVVVHAGAGTFEALRPLLPESAVHTCRAHPTAREDLERLAAELARLKAATGPVDVRALGARRKLDDVRALASFQFGAAVADALTKGGRASGHKPYVKLFGATGEQHGQTTPDRGVLSLTLEGAAIVARHGRSRVFIQDFHPRKTSSLFAVGVTDADPGVRPGDEVVVVHGDEVRGCGVAQMAAEEMRHLRRGVAVTLRHLAPAPVPKPAPALEALA